MKTLALIGLLAVGLVTAGCNGKSLAEILVDAGTPPGCIPVSVQMKLAEQGKPVPPCTRQATLMNSPQLYEQAPLPPMSPECTPHRVHIPNQGLQWVVVCR